MKPKPHHEKSWAAAAALATITLAAGLFHDFWNADVFIGAYDIYTQEYLRWEWGRLATIAHGRPPLWNPWLFGGYPFVSTFGFCPYYPLAWPFFFLPTPLALTARFALSLAIGAVGFYAFARTIRLRPAPALALALLYETGAHVVTLAYPGHLHKVEAIAWAPWAVAAAVMLARQGGARWALALAAAWSMQLLASHSQIFYATFWLAAFYAVAASGALAREKRSVRLALGRLGLLALAAGLTVGLSAIQMLPGLDMARHSNRAPGVALEATLKGALPAEELPEIVLPSFRGDSTETITVLLPGESGAREVPLPYVGRWHGVDEAKRLVSDYIGIWPALFALAGAALARGRKRWFFLASSVVAMMISIGDATPLFRAVFHVVPGFSKFRSPATFTIAAHFSLFALAALGLQTAIERLERASFKQKKRVAAVLLIVSIAGFVGWGLLRAWQAGAPLVAESKEDTLDNIRAILLGRSARHVALFLGAGALALALAARARKPWLVWAGAGACLVAALIDTGSQARRFLPRHDVAPFEYFISSSWIETAILADAGPDAPAPTYIEPGKELNNRAMMRNVRSTHGYHPLVYSAYEKLTQACGGLESPTFMRHFAQNYIVSTGDGAPAEGWRVAASKGETRLLARETALPFARVPHAVRPLGARWDDLDVNAWRLKIGGADFDPARTVLCEGDYAWRPTSGTEPLVSVLSETPRPGEYRLRLTAPPDASAHVDSEGFLPCLVAVPGVEGWRARVVRDGASQDEPTEWLENWPRRANGLFLLAPLSPEPGARTILEYAPASARWGAATTLLTLIGIVLFAFGWRFRHVFTRASGANQFSDYLPPNSIRNKFHGQF